MCAEREKRRTPRRTEALILKYSVDDEKDRRLKLHYGVTANTCSRGMCFLSRYNFAPNQRLRFTSSKKTCTSGVVRWTKKVTASLYRIGVECE